MPSDTAALIIPAIIVGVLVFAAIVGLIWASWKLWNWSRKP